MNLKKVYLNTLVPELPVIINYNNEEFKRYLDLFYNEKSGILTVPLTTTGRVKGATGEFVNITVDNLTVRNQYTNLYDNNTTADFNWYKMMIDPVYEPRDPCTNANFWPKEDILGYKVVDVNKPYYRVTNETPVILNNNNLSQVVGIFFDEDTVGSDPLTILMDPNPNSPTYMRTYTIDVSYAGAGYVELVATSYDPSWGSTWELYKYAFEGTGGGGGSGTVGPGTPNYIPVFKTLTTIGDSAIYMDDDTLVTKDVSITGPVDMDGVLNVVGSIFLNGTELGAALYDPPLDDDLAVPSPGVGGIAAGTTVGDLRGKTLEQLFSDILFPTVLASVSQYNALALGGITAGDVEVGTSYSPSLTASYNPGSISNGNGQVGPALTGNANLWTFRLPSGAIDSTVSAIGNSQVCNYLPHTINLGPNIWSVTCNYNAGSGAYYDNKGGVDNSLDALRIADSRNANSPTITGKRYAWRGWGAQNSAPIDSAGVRALPTKTFLSTNNTGTFKITIPPNTPEVYFFVPSGKTVKVTYDESSNADVTESFGTPTSISVNDAGGNAQTYLAYVSFIGVTGYPGTANYTVTIT